MDLKLLWKTRECSLWYIVLRLGYGFKVQRELCFTLVGRTGEVGGGETHPMRTLSLEGPWWDLSEDRLSSLTH